MKTTKTKKKPDVSASVESLPPGWRMMQIAIPDECWGVYVRAAIRIGCAPGDIVDHILRLGYEAHVKHEQENHVHHGEPRH